MAKSTDRTGEQKTPSVPSLAPTAVELDDLDRALFERLRIDGRESNRSLGSKLNVNGSSLAAGHPFAATGGRILAQAAKQLAQQKAERPGGGPVRALISICAAGGQGVAAILEV